MTNYEAIQKMTVSQMEWFLDQVYVAGINDGMYAARQPDGSFVAEEHFDLNWLLDSAEPALVNCNCEEDDELLSGLVKAVLRNSGISESGGY